MPPKPQGQDDQLLSEGAISQQAEAAASKRVEDEEDDDDDHKPGRERRKIEIKFIDDKARRHITFSKRKAGIMKKAYELSVFFDRNTSFVTCFIRDLIGLYIHYSQVTTSCDKG